MENHNFEHEGHVQIDLAFTSQITSFVALVVTDENGRFGVFLDDEIG